MESRDVALEIQRVVCGPVRDRGGIGDRQSHRPSPRRGPRKPLPGPQWRGVGDERGMSELFAKNSVPTGCECS